MNNTELHRKIEQALRAERPLRQAPPGFAERVIDALPSRPLSEGRAPRSPSRAIWPRLVFAGGLALATFLMWKGFAPKPSQAPVLAQEAPSIEKILPVKAPSMEQVQALTAKIDQPLEKELERVMADTRNAIRFVASNFMPEQN